MGLEGLKVSENIQHWVSCNSLALSVKSTGISFHHCYQRVLPCKCRSRNRRRAHVFLAQQGVSPTTQSRPGALPGAFSAPELGSSSWLIAISIHVQGWHSSTSVITHLNNQQPTNQPCCEAERQSHDHYPRPMGKNFNKNGISSWGGPESSYPTDGLEAEQWGPGAIPARVPQP